MVVEADRVAVLVSSVVAVASSVDVEVEVERAVAAVGRVAVEVSRASSGRRFFVQRTFEVGRSLSERIA